MPITPKPYVIHCAGAVITCENAIVLAVDEHIGTRTIQVRFLTEAGVWHRGDLMWLPEDTLRPLGFEERCSLLAAFWQTPAT